MKRVPLTAGIAIRRKVRRLLLELGIEFTEEKGWLDSVFYVPAEKAALVSSYFTQYT